MYIIKDPDWYLKDQSKPDKIYSNLIFLAVSIYLYNKNQQLSLLFFLLFLGSSLFHIKTNRKTLAIDRITMVLVFSYFFHMFYNKIPFMAYSIIGLLSVLYWFLTENLLFFFLYQLGGLLLFLFSYPMDIVKKLIIITLYIGITYSQLLEKGKYHSLKHIALAILSVYLYDFN
jgi:hypothetical protein